MEEIKLHKGFRDMCHEIWDEALGPDEYERDAFMDIEDDEEE